MKHFPICRAVGILGLALAVILALAQVSRAQQTQPGQPPDPQPAKPSLAPPSTTPPTTTITPVAPGATIASGAPAETPKVDPAEEAAYKSFSDIKTEDTDKRIQAGEQFVQKYPTSRYGLAIYTSLTDAYYSKQEIDKMFAAADKALALDPDDVSVLVMVGWVIPHSHDPNDLEADRKLDKAEAYEKHALEVLASMPKPANLTDDQFAKVKIQAQSQAHSALGLVYYRRQDLSKSIAEFQLGTSTAPAPDPVDYFVMGIELQKLAHYSEAADSFHKCNVPGSPMMDRCKAGEEQARKTAASSPAAPVPPKQ
jgi:tetratricopeptide (TPR) repeat protein